MVKFLERAAFKIEKKLLPHQQFISSCIWSRTAREELDRSKFSVVSVRPEHRAGDNHYPLRLRV